MSRFQFAGAVQGRAQTEAVRYGTKSTGMSGQIGGWKGMIETRVWYDEKLDADRFRVKIIPHWHDSGGEVILAEGILDHEITDPFVVPAVFA